MSYIATCNLGTSLHLSRMLMLAVCALLPGVMCSNSCGAQDVNRRLYLEKLGARPEKWQEFNACGPNCLFVFMRMHGVEVSHSELLSTDGDLTDGTSLEQLKQMCETRGLQARVVRATLDSLAHVQLPVIAHLDNGAERHFVVLCKIEGDEVVTVDGTHGMINRLSRDDFLAKWSGYALIRHTWFSADLAGNALIALVIALVAAVSWDLLRVRWRRGRSAASHRRR